MTPNPIQQLAQHRNWQTLGTYVRAMGGVVSTVNQLVQGDVCHYFRQIMCDVDMTPDEIIADFLPVAKNYVEAQFSVTNWRNTLNAFQVKVHSLHLFRDVPEVERKAFVGVVVEMLGRMNVEIGGRTENNGGVISVAKAVISEGENTAIFALFHEIGHGVQTEPDVPKSIKDAIFTSSETGARFGELFADAFAAIALRAIGRSPEQIMNGAKGALSDHGEDADHPDWPTRKNSIRTTLGSL
jgi:hypothetical protein